MSTVGQPSIQDQAASLLVGVAGYIGYRTIGIGVESGLVAALAQKSSTPEELARRLDLDPFYVEVWCRAALGAGALERSGDGGFELGPHVETLLLDEGSPGYIGAMFSLFEQPEVFDRFSTSLGTGERTWWDQCGPEFIALVSRTGRAAYTRLIPGGLSQVPALGGMRAGARILDTACGAGAGLILLAETYPDSTLVGVDGDAYSLSLAESRIADAGFGDRVELVHSPLEEMDGFNDEFDLVINNISMHECRDIERVSSNIRQALRPGGTFVISDFPFPDDDDDAALRSVPGRIMSGIQFFEAQIDDQLLPVSSYLDLLERHDFREVGTVPITPVHALSFGTKPD